MKVGGACEGQGGAGACREQTFMQAKLHCADTVKTNFKLLALNFFIIEVLASYIISHKMMLPSSDFYREFG